MWKRATQRFFKLTTPQSTESHTGWRSSEDHQFCILSNEWDWVELTEQRWDDQKSQSHVSDVNRDLWYNISPQFSASTSIMYQSGLRTARRAHPEAPVRSGHWSLELWSTEARFWWRHPSWTTTSAPRGTWCTEDPWGKRLLLDLLNSIKRGSRYSSLGGWKQLLSRLI